MPTTVRLYKKGRRFYAEWYDPDRVPKKKYEALGTDDERAARRRLQRLEIDLIDGRHDPWDRKRGTAEKFHRLGAAVEGFLRTKQHLAEKSRKNYSAKLGLLVDHLGAGTDVRQVREEDIRDFLDNGRRSLTSQRTYLTHVSAFFRWLRQQGVIGDDPCRGVDLGRKQKVRVVKSILHDELDRITDRMEGEADRHPQRDPVRTRVLVRLYRVVFCLGLRAREATSMRWSWVDLDGAVLRIPNDETFSPKGKEEQKVRIVPPAMDILRAMKEEFDEGVERESIGYEDGFVLDEEDGETDPYVFSPDGRGTESFTTDNVGKTFKRWVRRVLPEHRSRVISLHSLRHGTCLHILRATGDIEVAREHLRHSDISVTQVYSRYTDGMYRDALDRAMG